jgi:hypothetical protein
MKIPAALVSLFACLAGAAPASAGGLLVTPPVLADTANVVCLVNHLGDDNTAATASVRNATGVVVDGGSPYPIYPGLNSPASQVNVTGFYYCVFEGLTKEMRGYIMLNDGGQSALVLPASR